MIAKLFRYFLWGSLTFGLVGVILSSLAQSLTAYLLSVLIIVVAAVLLEVCED